MKQPFNCADQARDSWHDRALRACALVAPYLRDTSVASVADIGCGDMKFEQALQAGGLVVEYHAFDLHPQHPRVRPFDANTQPLPAHFDLLVMLGVTEYLSDLPASLARFAPATRLGLFSHVVSELSSHQPGRIAELGWRNHLSSGEFESVCERSGWQAVDSVLTANGRTRIWLLRGRGANAGP